MARPNIPDLLKASGYYTTGGHFKLSSRDHSDAYVQARIAMMDPATCQVFVEAGREQLRTVQPTVIAGFTVGGLLFAHALAKSLRLPLLRGRQKGGIGVGEVEWVNEDELKRDARVVLVEDVFTTPSLITPAIAALEKMEVAELAAVLIAVNRAVQMPRITFRGNEVLVRDCVSIPLAFHAPGACPMCRDGIPYTDLSNPDRDWVSVVLSQPQEKSEFIVEGYERVFRMQQAADTLKEIETWKPWLPVLVAGLPMARMQEDSCVVRFVSHLTDMGKQSDIKPRVLSELVGQLVILSGMRVESRPIGCSLIVGDAEAVCKTFESRARVKWPVGASFNLLTNLVPYFDAFLETNYVMVLDREGNLVGIRKLVYHRRDMRIQGIEALRLVTSSTNALGFALRRGRSAISVYGRGRLEAVGELSQRTGLWEFSRPMERIDEINKLIPHMGEQLVAVIEAARELVAKGHGALFIVGDSKGLKHTEPKVEVEMLPFQEMQIDDIVELAKLDGAVIVDEQGQLTCATVIIQNKGKQDREDWAQPGDLHGGSRRETARRTSVECPNCAAVYISQNGTIEVYVRGNSWPITEAISGLGRD